MKFEVQVHRNPYLQPRCAFDTLERCLSAEPIHDTIAALVCHGVFDRFPELNFVFAHGGGSFHGTLGRIDHGHAVRPDLCQSHTTARPSDYLKRFWVDSLVHDPAMLSLIVSRMGANRVCLGTDYPFPLGELQPGELIESSSFDAETKELLLSGAALEAFHLKRERFLR